MKTKREELIDFLDEALGNDNGQTHCLNSDDFVDHYLSTHPESDGLPEPEFDENTECTLSRFPKNCSIIKYTQFKECNGAVIIIRFPHHLKKPRHEYTSYL